jgi:riboflavin transporter FmnP
VKFPTGGKQPAASPRAARRIWCDAKADSIVWMKEERRAFCALLMACVKISEDVSGIFLFGGFFMRGNSRANYFTKVGILSAVAVILMYFEVPVPMMPAFLKLDASEVPAILGAFILGPGAGVCIELVKNLLHSFYSQTMGIGEMANFLVGVSFVVPAGIVYRRSHSRRGAVLALALGTVTMVLSAALLNYYVLLPLYQLVLHFPMKQMIAMGTAANPRITDLAAFVTLAVAPFNLVKGLAISAFSLLLYRRISPILCDL